VGGSLIPRIGYFCKNCGGFFTFIGAERKETVVDDDGWGVSTIFACPSCRHEAEYLSSEATLESEEDRKFFGLS